MKRIKNLPAVVILGIIMLVCLVIDFFTNGLLNRSFGIVPRDIDSLLGIILHPFAHGDLGHFLNNIIAFFILGFFLRQSYSDKQMYLLFIILAVIGGICTWLFAGTGLHIGASGVVFGMWSSLITFAVKRRKIKDILIGIVIALFYGTSFIMGIIPRDNISYEGHFFGIVAGILVSLFVIKYKKADDEKKKDEENIVNKF